MLTKSTSTQLVQKSAFLNLTDQKKTRNLDTCKGNLSLSPDVESTCREGDNGAPHLGE